jgi:hypothetical protein
MSLIQHPGCRTADLAVAVGDLVHPTCMEFAVLFLQRDSYAVKRIAEVGAAAVEGNDAARNGGVGFEGMDASVHFFGLYDVGGSRRHIANNHADSPNFIVHRICTAVQSS